MVQKAYVKMVQKAYDKMVQKAYDKMVQNACDTISYMMIERHNGVIFAFCKYCIILI